MHILFKTEGKAVDAFVIRSHHYSSGSGQTAHVQVWEEKA